MSEQRSNQDADPDRGRKIEVVPYDPGWPVAFDRERQRIQRALGGAALNIEHVGSTSVPGLAAKPVIDIHLTVQDSADEGAYGPALEAAGYRLMHRAPGWFEHRLFKGLGPEVNLHVFSAGCPELARCLLFRDWLRVSPSDRALYTGVKQRLALQAWDHVQDYADAKQGVIADIMTRADAWARTGRPSPQSGA